MNDIELKQGDCLELMRKMPAGSVDLIIADPPYNIGVQTQEDGRKKRNAWDVVADYREKMQAWTKEFSGLLKPTGVLYLWHNDIAQFPRILCDIAENTELAVQSFCIWDKGVGFRAQSWHNRLEDSRTAPRSWFNICEYCFHFFKAPKSADAAWGRTGLERVYSTPECFTPLKEWYAGELSRLNITPRDIAAKYEEATGKKPYMLRHYFQDSQFEIPTEQVWNAVYIPLGFSKEYEALRAEYEALRAEYEALRNVHHVDTMHCNVWHVPPLSSNNRLHTCQKPLEIYERLVRVSSNPGALVLDPFMGSGTAGVACVNTGRRFVGMELMPEYFATAEKRIKEAEEVAGCERG